MLAPFARNVVLESFALAPGGSRSLCQQHHRQCRRAERGLSMVGHGGPVFCLAPLGELRGAEPGLATGSYDATIKATPRGLGEVRGSFLEVRNFVSLLSPIGETVPAC